MDGIRPAPGALDTVDAGLSVVAPHRSMAERLRLIWRYRELLSTLVRKDLKVRYKGSTLGFAWSMLNPLLYLVVYWLVFEVILHSGIPDFPIWLLAGLLPWTLFSTSLTQSTTSITLNGSLVKKVYFPREILPMATIGAALVHYVLQTGVLVAVLIALRWSVDPAYVWLVLPALLVMLLLSTALALLVAAFNVRLRDTQHLLELVLLAWFWATPIVYTYMLLAERLGQWSWALQLNPMTPIVVAYQRAIYGQVYGAVQPDGSRVELLPHDASQLWYLRNLAIVGIAASILVVLAFKVFDRYEGTFAEEI